MTCPNCNSIQGGNYCAKCGTELMRNLPKCPMCNITASEVSDKFCFVCGKELVK